VGGGYVLTSLLLALCMGKSCTRYVLKYALRHALANVATRLTLAARRDSADCNNHHNYLSFAHSIPFTSESSLLQKQFSNFPNTNSTSLTTIMASEDFCKDFPLTLKHQCNVCLRFSLALVAKLSQAQTAAGSVNSHPFFVEHRLGLETTIKTKSRLIQQTRLIQPNSAYAYCSSQDVKETGSPA
jgi:hypothetical protein